MGNGVSPSRSCPDGPGIARPGSGFPLRERRNGSYLVGMNAEDETLIRTFEELSLGLQEWTQRTHVAIAFLYLREHGFDGALDRLRHRIRAFNARYGIEESPTRGYNETTTVALLTLVETVRQACGAVIPAASAAEFCDAHPQLMSKHILRFFYSPERRMHPDAKARFVEPDLAPLPRFSA